MSLFDFHPCKEFSRSLGKLIDTSFPQASRVSNIPSQHLRKLMSEWHLVSDKTNHMNTATDWANMAASAENPAATKDGSSRVELKHVSYQASAYNTSIM